MSFGQAPANLNVTKYTGDQLSDVPCVNVGRAPRTTDINYPLLTLWRNSDKLATLPDTEGDVWYLARFQPNGPLQPLAIWVKITSDDIEDIIVDTGTSPVFPILNAITFTGTGISGGGIQTVGSAGTVGIQMSSPFNLSSFAFPQGVYSFLDPNFLSSTGTTSTVTTITDGSQWMFFASTNAFSVVNEDPTFTAIAVFLGTSAPGIFVVQPLRTSQIAFNSGGNNVRITNTSPANRRLNVSGIRLF